MKLITVLTISALVFNTPTNEFKKEVGEYETEANVSVMKNTSTELCDSDLRIRLVTLLLDGKIDEFEQLVKKSPNLSNKTEDGEFAVVMALAVTTNNMPLIKWLHENCIDCNLNNSGHAVIHRMGSNYEGYPWRAMNASTFKYVYDNGGVTSFEKRRPEKPIFVAVAEYWIPEGDGVYGDYQTTENDKKFEQERHDDRRNMLSYLIEQGHEVNEVDEHGNTALFNAVSRHDEPLLDFLIEQGAKIDTGKNALATITGRVDLAYLKKLLSLGYNVNTVTQYHYASPKSTTLLGRIVEGGKFNQELLSLLENHNVDFSLVDSHGKAPIDYAFNEFDQSEQPFTEYLLSKGAKKTDQYYYSALVSAVQNNKNELLKDILSSHPHLASGLKPDEKTYPLERAVWNGDKTSFQLLLDAGAKIHDENFYSTRLFDGAVMRENYELAQLILDSHPTIPVNRPSERDGKVTLFSNALKEASSKGELEWVNKLIEMDGSLEANNFFGYPIVGAAYNGHFDVVKALIEAGSAVNPTDDEGKSLFDAMKEAENMEMLEFLQSF